MTVEELARRVSELASRCLGCGFCEPACPVLRHGPHRGYGPRGRVAAAAAIASGRPTREALASVYSCLLCRACVSSCPVGLDVAWLSRAARSLALRLGGGRAPVFQVEARGRR